MAGGQTHLLWQYLQNLVRRHVGGSQTDGQLLERFMHDRDETAFEVLVWRHGPMILALGQRLLGNVHDAEDVLQATFLTLVRKAGSIGKSEALSSWLYQVAYRIALRSRARTAKRAAEHRRIEDVPAADESEEAVWRELRPLLDAAIERLPEKYQTAIVLCDLQGKTHREAAEQLGCSVGTISTRVIRARQLLRKRLAHHGLSVSLGMLSAALAQRTSAALTASTVRAAVRLVSDGGTAGIVSSSVVELMEGANQAMSMSRFKIAMFVAVAVGAVAVGAVSRAALRNEPPTSSAEAPPAEAKTKAPTKKPADAVTVRGRVVDPDGKPVKGARLYWPRVPKEAPKTDEDIEIPERGQSDSEGRFHIELPRSDIKPEWRLSLVAAADGYGVAGAEWPAIEKGGELTLRLVKDRAIEGRVLTSEGKPVAGVRVSIHSLAEMTDGKVDAFVTAWKREWETALNDATKRMFLPLFKILNPAKTDANGSFRVNGAGVDCLVVLRLRGSGIVQDLFVVNRAGFDAAPVNKAVLARIPARLRLPGRPPLLYGPKLAFVLPARRRIEGIVREAGSGKPVAGYRIHIITGYNFGIDAVSDKEGRYQLNGVPKVGQYLLNAEPPAGSAWLRAGARRDDAEGVQPLTVDFTVAHGIILSGRVIDRTTGKGVQGGVRFVPLPGNKFAGKPGYDSYKYESLVKSSDAEGRFKLSVIPGAGVLMVQALGTSETANGGQKLNPYKRAEFDAKDREHVKITDENGEQPYFTRIDNTLEFLSTENAVKYLDLPPDASTATSDLFVERGLAQTIHIKDADGKPLKGTTVAGVTASWPFTFAIPDATCTIFALDPKKPRRLLFFHAEGNLAGTLALRGDEKEPSVVRLERAGSMMGRILDRDDQPLAGADIQLSASDRITRGFYQKRQQRQQAIRTDKEGRFRVEGIVPRVKFTLGITKGRTGFVGESRIGDKEVKPGETLDLGDVRVKPAQ